MDAAVGRLCRHHAAAISSISSKIEVAHVLEGMLDDLEAWQWAGRVKELEARLRRSEATVAALRAAEEKHLQREAEFRAKEEKDAARAEELRGRLAREMWNVAKELKRQRAQRVRTAELSVQVARLQGMEEELSRARIELAAAQVASSPPPAPATPPATAKSGGAAPSTAARCVLLALQDSSLLKVFSFLEAPSVLNTAAACRGTFRKVDALFGFGNSESILQGSSSPPASSDPLKTPPRSAKQPSHSSVGSGFKSLFATVSQVRDEKEANAFPSTSSKEGNEGLALTADMVNAMALKLSNAEMKGIISMTARNKALTAQASQLRTEKEDVLEKLRSTEEVKEFLVQKLKETEAALKKSLDEKARTDRQAASDQEVIGFLDARAQQLERTAKDAVDKYLQHQAELENAKVDTAKKSKMLEDMLRFEKEKAEQNEAQFKQEKKLLITEVKKLRTQTLALQGEADDAKKQLRELRRSIAGK